MTATQERHTRNADKTKLQHKLLLDMTEGIRENSTVASLKSLKVSEELHADAKAAAARLRVPLSEFIRRAVARELAYNDRRGSRKKEQ